MFLVCLDLLALYLFVQLLAGKTGFTIMTEIIAEREIPFQELFKILHKSTDFASDLIRTKTFGICFLTVTFSLFLLILSLVYIHPNLSVMYCDIKVPENVPEILCSDPSCNLAVERYVGTIAINDITENSGCSFLPDVSEIQVIDELTEFSVPPTLVEAESTEHHAFKNADSIGKSAQSRLTIEVNEIEIIFANLCQHNVFYFLCWCILLLLFSTKKWWLIFANNVHYLS